MTPQIGQVVKFWLKISIFEIYYRPFELKISTSVDLLRPKRILKQLKNNFQTTLKKVKVSPKNTPTATATQKYPPPPPPPNLKDFGQNLEFFSQNLKNYHLNLQNLEDFGKDIKDFGQNLICVRF